MKTVDRLNDITMCMGEGCPLTEKCLRYRAKPDGYQSYFLTAPNVGDTCEMMIDIDWRRRVRSLKEVKRSNELPLT